MIRFIVQRDEKDPHSGLEQRSFVTIDASVPALEHQLRAGGRSESGFESYQLIGVQLLEVDQALEPLPYWEPCNPGCDPELNGHRSKHCATLCHNAREALAAQGGEA